ncbi:MAG: hypothetical protein U0168_02140 [Nannocystaceae bacterium]
MLTALTACHPAGTKPPSAAITTTDATRAAPTLVGLTATLDRGSLPPDTTTRVVAQLRLDAGAVAPVASAGRSRAGDRHLGLDDRRAHRAGTQRRDRDARRAACG